MPAPEVIADVPTLPPRDPEGHKGTYGRILLVAGSRGMSGAAVLSGTAALRGGAGLVFVATPTDVASIVATGNPCYLTVPLPHDAAGRVAESAADELAAHAAKADVVAIGPGLGQGPELTRLVARLAGSVAGPLVLDADGLNNLADRPDVLAGRRGRQTVLTPHPGEFARISGVVVADQGGKREEVSVRFASERGVVLVLKGHRTLVTDGRRLYRNTTGNPGMGTGGTGDVLTGLLAALLGQGLAAFEAAVLAVYLHGLAGDLARDAVGEVSLIASDLPGHLPAAFRRHLGR